MVTGDYFGARKDGKRIREIHLNREAHRAVLVSNCR